MKRTIEVEQDAATPLRLTLTRGARDVHVRVDGRRAHLHVKIDRAGVVQVQSFGSRLVVHPVASNTVMVTED